MTPGFDTGRESTPRSAQLTAGSPLTPRRVVVRNGHWKSICFQTGESADGSDCALNSVTITGSTIVVLPGASAQPQWLIDRRRRKSRRVESGRSNRLSSWSMESLTYRMHIAEIGCSATGGSSCAITCDRRTVAQTRPSRPADRALRTGNRESSPRA
jgi:hypothetical protein